MRFIEAVERQVRNLGRDVVPPPIKRQLWFYYMEGKRMVETRSLNMFGQVHVEVNTHCDKACPCCSNRLYPKEEAYMDIEVFRRIVDELFSIKYRGKFSPNLSSEPTLDPRLPELMTYARRIKDARLVLYTHGERLNPEKLRILKKAGVDEFIITQHEEIAPQVLIELMHGLTTDERRSVTFQTLADVNLFNFGIPKLIPPGRRAIPDPCFVASNDLTILVNGDVVQCCIDFRGEHVFGNVMERPIMDIWDGPMYREFRSEVRNSRFNHDICQRCIFDVSQQTSPPTYDNIIGS